jgi:hypothetical protein
MALKRSRKTCRTTSTVRVTRERRDVPTVIIDEAPITGDEPEP